MIIKIYEIEKVVKYSKIFQKADHMTNDRTKKKIY